MDKQHIQDIAISKSDLSQIDRLLPEYVSYINNKLGIVIKNNQYSSLKRIISEACEEFKLTPEEYLKQLKMSDVHSPLGEFLVSGVTIGETYFFRDSKQIDLLKSYILPAIIEAKRKGNVNTIRIWSSGCSSGEEIYTVAMLLSELLPDISKWTISLIGTDLNTNLLKKAIHGEYGLWSLRSTDKYYQNKYFIKTQNGYMLNPKIRHMVKFSYMNLNDDCYEYEQNINYLDMIICRNVLIYLNENLIDRIMKKLYELLSVGGYLLLGASDPIRISNIRFKISDQYSMLLIKEESKEESTPNITNVNLKTDNSYTNLVQPSKNDNTFNKSILTYLYNQKKWKEIVIRVNEIEQNSSLNTEMLVLKATALANLGNLDNAIDIYKSCINNEKTNKKLYLDYAMALIESDKLNAAESALRSAIFLDHAYVFAHYQLGLLLIRNSKIEEGLKSLKNAYNIAINQQPTLKVIDGGELTYGKFASILENELMMYTG